MKARKKKAKVMQVYKINVVNGFFIYQYRDFYKKYDKLMTQGAVPWTSFSRAIRSVLPFEPTREELALVRTSKKVHTTFSVRVRKGKVPVTTLVTVALLRAMARDMPEFQQVYEGDLQKIREEISGIPEKKEEAKQNVQ